MPKIDKRELRAAQALADEGRLLAEGYKGFAEAAVPEDAGQVQRDMMEMCFYSGALFMFSQLLLLWDDSEEAVTDRDDQRLRNIENELIRFQRKIMERSHG